MKTNLDMAELRIIRDYLRYVDVNIESLRNCILEVILSKGDLGISSTIDKYCSIFLYDREYTELIEVSDFIETNYNEFIVKG